MMFEKIQEHPDYSSSITIPSNVHNVLNSMSLYSKQIIESAIVESYSALVELKGHSMIQNQ